MPVLYTITLSFAALILLALPLAWLFGRSAAFGYLFGLLMMTVYLLCLLLFAEGPNDMS